MSEEVLHGNMVNVKTFTSPIRKNVDNLEVNP